MDDLSGYFKGLVIVDESVICECGHPMFEHVDSTGPCTVWDGNELDYADNCTQFIPRRVLGKVSTLERNSRAH